jgi:hypothetical protein
LIWLLRIEVHTQAIILPQQLRLNGILDLLMG